MWAESRNTDFWNTKRIVQSYSQLTVTFEAKKVLSTKKSKLNQMRDL